MSMSLCISIADDEAVSELGSRFSEESTNYSGKTVNNDDDDDNEEDIIISIKDFTSNEVSRYKTLDRFFKKLDVKKKELMVDIINKNSDISLRILDKFVTKYCSKMNTSYQLDKDSEDEFNVHISYKAQLKSYRKKFFDPFRRGTKFYYNYDKSDENKKTLTTLGQLNFFKWAFSNKIIDYVEKHRHDIVKVISRWDKDNVKTKDKTSVVKKRVVKPERKVSEPIIPNGSKIILTFD